jgi:hypothetical protein
MMDAACSYTRWGLSILPLHNIKDGECSCGNAECSSPGKHPRTKNGLKDASKDLTQISKWWGMWPDANIGVVTGKASGIVVIDIDGERGEESFANLVNEFYGPLPDTWEQITGGGGRHLVFIRPELESVGNKVGVAPGVDVRGDDGYIVVEPSNHISGRCYAWEVMHHPEETPIAALPEQWLEIFKQHSSFAPVDLPEVFGKGERNNLMFKLAASLRARGLSDSALLAALLAENSARCRPPLTDKEVETIAQSACKYTPGEIAQMARTAAAPPADIEAFKALLSKAESYYCDEVVSAVCALEAVNSPDYITAVNEVRAVDGFKARDFDRAVKMYKARQRGMHVVKDAEPSVLDKQLPGMPIQGLELPGDWRLSSEKQIYRIEDRGDQRDPVKVVACPHPVFIAERMTNLDAGTEKLRIAYYRDKQWRDMVVDAVTIASRNSIVQLANYGLQVTSESAKNLVTFLSDFLTVNKDRLPVSRSLSRLGWVDLKSFAPYTENVAYDGELAYKSIFEAVRSEGEYKDWLTMARELRGSVILRTVLAASFASPLVDLLGYQPFFVHLWGESGAGKTVAQQLALSVWGDPGQMLKTLNTTAVGLERHASFFRSLPVALDELQSLAQKYLTIDQIIYMLGLGKSKGRGAKAGGIEQESEWRNVFITSGEEPVSSENSQGGARNRVLEFYMDKSVYGPADPGEIAIKLSDTFGHAGRQYIEALIALMDGKRSGIKDLWQAFRAEIRDSEYTDKHIGNVAMLALGDYYSSRFVFGIDDDVSRAEAMVLAMELLERLDKASDIDPIRRAWDFVCGWTVSNADRFAYDYDGSAPRLGYLQRGAEITGEDEGDVLYVIPQALNDALRSAGFNPSKCFRGFTERGLIRSSVEAGKTRYALLKRINGSRLRVYTVPWPLKVIE